MKTPFRRSFSAARDSGAGWFGRLARELAEFSVRNQLGAEGSADGGPGEWLGSEDQPMRWAPDDGGARERDAA